MDLNHKGGELVSKVAVVFAALAPPSSLSASPCCSRHVCVIARRRMTDRYVYPSAFVVAGVFKVEYCALQRVFVCGSASSLSVPAGYTLLVERLLLRPPLQQPSASLAKASVPP